MDTTNFTDKIDLNVTDKKKLFEQLPIAKSFIQTLMKIHKYSEADAEMVFEREAMYAKKAIAGSDKLQQCTGISLYSSFLEIAIQGLSIQPGQKSEAYLEARGARVPNSNPPQWTQACTLKITAYGELNMRIMSGQIIRMNNPQVIYEGDHFQPKTNERGELIVDYAPKIPRQSTTIVGAYVCIVLPHNGLDFKWLLIDDINRLKKYSIPRGNQNGSANALYSSENGGIDPGFLEAKTIKHAMRAYTKMRVGETVAFDDEIEKEEAAENQNGFAPEAKTTTQEPVVIIEDTDSF